MKREKHTIDATDRVLGRLATEIAVLLRGKQKSNFVPYKDMGDFIIVKNVEKLQISRRKMEQKKYYHHSGFLGGLKEVPLKTIFKKTPEKILWKAVYGMLPKNKLRPKQIKRLKFE